MLLLISLLRMSFVALNGRQNRHELGSNNNHALQLPIGSTHIDPILFENREDTVLPDKTKRSSDIPTNLIFNYKENFLNDSRLTNRYIYSNVLNMIELHKGWNVIFDDDRQCAEK